MNKESRKNKLIKAMIESNRGWRFTEMQQFIYNLNYPGQPFTREQRGYWCANFTNGHMNSGGDGRIYKDGKLWYARWHTDQEITLHKVILEIEKLSLNSYMAGMRREMYGPKLFRTKDTINKITKIIVK